MVDPLDSPFFSLIKWWTIIQSALAVIIACIGLFFNRIENYFRKKNLRAQSKLKSELISAIVSKKIPYFASRYATVNLIPVIAELNEQETDPFWNEIKQYLFVKVLFPRARKMTYSHRWTKRILAMRCFLLFADKSNEGYILHLLQDPTPVIKYTAAYAAARLGTPKSTAAIVHEMDSSDRFLRHPFLDAFFKGDSHIFGYVEDILEKAENPYTKVSCLEILAQHMNERVVLLAHKNLTAQHKNLRIAAIRTLGLFPYKESDDWLIPLLGDSEWEIRAIAASSLGNLKAIKALPELAKLLGDKSWWVRMKAAIALKKIGVSGEKVLKEQSPQKDRYAYEIAQYVLPLDVEHMRL